jgi:hypothetical protein
MPAVLENRYLYPLATTMLLSVGAKTVRGYSVLRRPQLRLCVLFEYPDRALAVRWNTRVGLQPPAGRQPTGPDATGVSDRHHAPQTHQCKRLDWFQS